MVFAKSTLTLYNSTAYKKISLFIFVVWTIREFLLLLFSLLKKRRPKISDDKKVNLKNFFTTLFERIPKILVSLPFHVTLRISFGLKSLR